MRAKTTRRFWRGRVLVIALNAPVILTLQLKAPDLLVPYLVWMSWAAWLSSELPSPNT